MPSLQSLCFHEAGLYSENDAKVATMLGVRLVGQVLEEACTVASATQRIGWPWNCVLSMFKDLKAGKVTVPERDALFEYLQGDNKTVNETRDLGNITATSTPQKGEDTKMKPENLIGQGDEEIHNMCRHEQNQSLTMYINQLFDMSNEADVEKGEVEIVKTEMINQDDYKTSDIMYEIMENIFQRVEMITRETEANITKIPSKEEITFKNETVILEIEEEEDLKEKIRDIHFALVKEAYGACGLETVKCFLDNEDDDSMEDYVQVTNAAVHVHRSSDECDVLSVPVITARTEEDEKSEAARYENAYLTMNRDYEQCSDDGDPVFQDAKEPMQEVKLFPSSDDSDSSICLEEEAKKQLAATSGVSGMSGKSRISLVSRCKTQGARLLACLRGWWRRKTPGKRREGRTTGSIRGMCPLSPDARRRAASMLDQRELYSQPASRSAAWKFNTVNEGIVQSSRWQDYTYELAEKSSDEFC